MEDPMILTTITPESVALKHAQQPYRLRCLTESCYLATQTLGSRFIDVLDAPGELHARGTGHHVAIERVEEGQGMTFEPGRSDDRPDVLITLDDLAAAETAIRRLERVVATRRRRLREKEESLDVLRSQRAALATGYAQQAGM